MPREQFDLFPAEPEKSLAERAKEFDPSRTFVDKIRNELKETLALVEASASFPWPDLTQMTLAEMRFHSIARYLPAEEAAVLCAAFEKEMTRLYEVHDARFAE